MTRHDPTGPPTATLDARGLLCPLPVLLTVREIAKLPVGGRLIVEGDDPGILEDIPAWCELNGQRLLEIGHVAGREEAGIAEAPTAEATPPRLDPDEPELPPLIRAVIEKRC